MSTLVKLRSVECRVGRVECKVCSVECRGVWNAKCKVGSAKDCRLQKVVIQGVWRGNCTCHDLHFVTLWCRNSNFTRNKLTTRSVSKILPLLQMRKSPSKDGAKVLHLPHKTTSDSSAILCESHQTHASEFGGSNLSNNRSIWLNCCLSLIYNHICISTYSYV